MKYQLILGASASFFLFSCGSAKKLETANAQVQTLNNQVASLNGQIADYQKSTADLKAQNASYMKEAADCKELKEEVDKSLASLNDALAEQGTSLRELEEKAEVSLEKFHDAGIDVEYKDGFVRISVPDYLMFISGSTTVGYEGKEVLKVIAQELAKYPNLKIYVLGNTDSDQVNSKSKDNWTISTERANAVVRILANDYGIDPVRLTAGGRSKYHPIASNDTEEGKAANRRTDIILNPDFSAIWK